MVVAHYSFWLEPYSSASQPFFIHGPVRNLQNFVADLDQKYKKFNQIKRKIDFNDLFK